MKKLNLLLIAVAALTFGCSDDDSEAQTQAVQLCDCNKIIQEYDPNQGVWNFVESIPWGPDCSADTQGTRTTDENGVSYSIECTPQGQD